METFTHTSMINQTTQDIEQQAHDERCAEIVLRCETCSGEFSVAEYKEKDHCPHCKEFHMSTNGVCESCEEPLALNTVCGCYDDFATKLRLWNRTNEEWV